MSRLSRKGLFDYHRVAVIFFSNLTLSAKIFLQVAREILEG
jgi:hypothetical protein